MLSPTNDAAIQQQAEALKQERTEALEGVEASGAVPMLEDPSAAAAAAAAEPKAEPESAVSDVKQDGAEPAAISLEAPAPEADAAGAAGAAGDSGSMMVKVENSAAPDGQQGQPQQGSKVMQQPLMLPLFLHCIPNGGSLVFDCAP